MPMIIPTMRLELVVKGMKLSYRSPPIGSRRTSASTCLSHRNYNNSSELDKDQ
jgi:hypothetical protein